MWAAGAVGIDWCGRTRCVWTVDTVLGRGAPASPGTAAFPPPDWGGTGAFTCELSGARLGLALVHSMSNGTLGLPLLVNQGPVRGNCLPS